MTRARRIPIAACFGALLMLPAACAAESGGLFLTKVLFEDACIVDTDPPEGPALATAPIAAEELGPLGTIIGILAPKLVDLGTTLVAESIEKRGKQYSASFSGQTSGLLVANATGTVGCLIIARGAAIDKDAISSAQLPAVANELGIVGAPSFYFEAWVHYVDPARKAVSLTPAHFAFLAPAAERSSKSGRKDLIITVGLQATDDDATKLQYLIGLPNVPVGTVLDQKRLRGLRTIAQSLPLAQEGIAMPALGSGAAVAPVPASKAINFNVTIGETEDSGDIHLRFAEVVKDSKEKLDPALTDVLLKLMGSE